MKTRFAFAVLVLVLLAGLGTAHAQVWDKKDYRQWSKSETTGVLENSPWAKIFTLAEERQEAFSVDSSFGRGREASVRVNFIAQIRSATPIRQGVVRQLMLDNKYDRMTPEQKADFDQRTAQYLDRTFDDQIVIQVRMASNVQIYMRQLVSIWQGINEGAVPAGVYLILTNGQRITPVHFVAPTHSNPVIELVFPRRTQDGNLVDADDKEFTLEVPGISISGQTGEEILRFTFNPPKMKYKGDFVY